MPTTLPIHSTSDESLIRPASRASWTGSLTFNDLSIPVKAYSLSVSSPPGPLCQIHAGCGQKLEYHRSCPTHGPIPYDQIGKAYPYTENELIELTEHELHSLAPSFENVVTLKQFIEPNQINWTFLSGRSFALVPTHKAAHTSYRTFVEALEESGVYGFGTIGLSGRLQLQIARVIQQQIILFLLHWPAHRRVAPAIDPVQTSEISNASNHILRKINKEVMPIAWEQMVDEWELRLSEMVQQKVVERMTSKALPARRHRTPTNSNKQSQVRRPRKSRAA